MSPRFQRTAALLALTTAVCAPHLAVAQQAQNDEPDPNITVRERPRPDYDPLGIRAGSFLIFPALTLSGLYDSNVFATKNDTDSDVAGLVSPQMDIKSNWSRNAVNFSAGATGAAYANYSSNDYIDAFASAGGRLDVTRDDIVSGTLRFDRLHQDRSDPDQDVLTTVGGSSGRGNLTRYYRADIDGQYRHNFPRLFTVVGGGVQRLFYEDVGDTENSQRDRWEYGARARVGYQVSPRIGTFVQGNYSYRDYDDDQIIDGEEVSRNSSGFRAAIGTEVDITSILFGEVSLGYTWRHYDSSELNDASGWGADSKLTWNVTPLTSVVLNASTGIDETTVIFEGDAATANLQNTVVLDVTHELLRNVLLNANVGYARDDFEGTGRTDNIFSAGTGVSYLLNRNLSLDARYRFTKRDSDDEEIEFNRNIVLVGITAKL
jgi:hypothetical protein